LNKNSFEPVIPSLTGIIDLKNTITTKRRAINNNIFPKVDNFS
jgi:hypothetical protein